MYHCYIAVVLCHIILSKSAAIPDCNSVLDQSLALALLLLIFTPRSYYRTTFYAVIGQFVHSHMGSLLRVPYFHPSLSLPSMHHLCSPDSPVHRHLVPPPLKPRCASASAHPLAEKPLTELEVETLNSSPHYRSSSDHANRILAGSRHTDASKSCSLCHNLIPDHVEPCTFPETAPAAVAALSPHIPMSTGPRIFCYACWVWIHNLSICWACGDTVSRKEERVSYGWCWWHWGCVSCLFCRVCGYVSRSHSHEIFVFAFGLNRNMGKGTFLEVVSGRETKIKSRNNHLLTDPHASSPVDQQPLRNSPSSCSYL